MISFLTNLPGPGSWDPGGEDWRGGGREKEAEEELSPRE